MFKNLFAPKTDNAAIEASKAILASWDTEDAGQWMTEIDATPAERLEWTQGR